jgi:nucleotide-binding universal stress UspA family protein
VARSVNGIIRNSNAYVETVYVMTPSEIGVPLLQFPEHQDYYKAIATERMKKILGDLGEQVTTKITVLPQGSNSIRASVETLLKHIENHGADLVAVSTHARKGIDRFFLGSFAEALLLRSHIPLLISNPMTPWDPAYYHMLFATELDEDCQTTFHSTLTLAKQLGSKITLFHRHAPEKPLMMPPGFFTFNEWRSQKIERQSKAENLQVWAEKQGVKVEIDVDADSRKVSNAVLNAADRLKVSLIVMAARRSLDVFAMGSIPRQIIRAANCPVLILPIA